jgi:hypothetical protein
MNEIETRSGTPSVTLAELRRLSNHGLSGSAPVLVTLETDDLFRLCRGRAVKFSSRGFISGGIRLILRNSHPNQALAESEIRWVLPAPIAP